MPSASKETNVKSTKQDKNWDALNKDMESIFKSVSKDIEEYDKRSKYQRIIAKVKNILNKDKQVSKTDEKDKGQIIEFKDLTEEEKQILTLVIPITVLKDPNTTLIRYHNGVSVKIKET